MIPSIQQPMSVSAQRQNEGGGYHIPEPGQVKNHMGLSMAMGVPQQMDGL